MTLTRAQRAADCGYRAMLRVGLVRARRSLTVFLVETTMALVENNDVFVSKGLNIGHFR